MRFAFISTMTGAPWGGSEELWSRAALKLRQAGHETSASVMWWPKLSEKVTNMMEQGVQVAVQPPPHARFPVRIWRQLKKRTGATRPESTWLRRMQPDLVVISQGDNRDGLDWMSLSRENKLPYVAIIQCNAESWWPPDGVGREMAASYRAARKVFCVSHHNLDLLRNQIGEPLPNGEVAWNPYNVPAVEPPAWPKDNGVWKLACVARLEPAAKGQDVLFEVLSKSKWRERPVEMNLFGAGMCEGNLKKMIDNLKLKNVHLRGHVSDVRKIWEENHLLVLPSRYEGLPLALVEAMWCARPAVVTDIGGNAEMCLDGETGFVAPAPTVGLLDEALERAWNRRNEWQEIGRLGRVRAEKLVPKDPVDIFCKQLTEAAHG